jgi:hypothetical protein
MDGTGPGSSTVALIVKLLSLADQQQRSAAHSRYQAATLMKAELDRGVSSRALARAIHKSQSFVARSVRAYEVIEADDNLGPEDFQAQYAMAKSRSSSNKPSQPPMVRILKDTFTTVLNHTEPGQAPRLAEVCQGFVNRAKRKATAA